MDLLNLYTLYCIQVLMCVFPCGLLICLSLRCNVGKSWANRKYLATPLSASAESSSPHIKLLAAEMICLLLRAGLK